MKKSKVFLTIFIIAFVILVSLPAALVVYVDPYFHYHKPLEGKNYIYRDQRYLNDGIVKNFDYDAMITGSSMTECMRPSVMNSLFGTKGIKVPFSGGSFLEVGDLVRTACKANPNLKMVVRGLDCNRFFNTKDERDYEADSYPTYLYDSNILNDTKYVFSKNAIVEAALILIQRGEASHYSSMDTYSNWSADYKYGKDVVLKSYSREDVTPAETQINLTDEEKQIMYENITANVTDIADEYPDVEFYLYYTPYSIYYIDYYKRLGELERQIEAEKYITSLLLEHENIHVYSFYMQHELIEDLNNYKDLAHHGQAASDMILNWIYDGTGEITKENYELYYDELREYYFGFDYDSVF